MVARFDELYNLYLWSDCPEDGDCHSDLLRCHHTFENLSFPLVIYLTALSQCCCIRKKKLQEYSARGRHVTFTN